MDFLCKMISLCTFCDTSVAGFVVFGVEMMLTPRAHNLQIAQEFDKEEKFLEGSVLQSRVIKLMIYITLLSHWVACALYVTGSTDEVEPGVQ